MTDWPARGQQAPDFWDTQLKAYVDEHDVTAQAAALAAANAHADSGDATTLASANSHSDTAAASALASANSHSDTALAAATAFMYPCSNVDNLRTVRATDTAVLAGANSTLYFRTRYGATITGIDLEVTTQNGNIAVGVFANNGSQARAARPTTRSGWSGAVACPSVGFATVALTGGLTVNPGDWLAIWSDSATAAFRALQNGELTSAFGHGLSYKQTSTVAMPSSVGTLVAITGRNPVLVGS